MKDAPRLVPTPGWTSTRAVRTPTPDLLRHLHGLASGNDRAEALSHGALEMSSAIGVAVGRALDEAQQRRQLDPANID